MSNLKPCRWRSAEPLSSGRWGCASSKLLVPPEGVPEEVCRKSCYCVDHEPTGIERTSGCIFLGLPTGKTVPCASCKGTVNLPLLHCGVYGECVVGKSVSSAPGCGDCARRQDRIAAQRTVQIDPKRLAHADSHTNCGLAEIGGKLWLAYRAGHKGALVHLCELGRDYQPTGKHHPIRPFSPRCAEGREDPRLFWHDGQLYCSIIGVEEERDRPGAYFANQLVCRLNEKLQPVETWQPEYRGSQHWEKNWAFFSHAGRMHAVYSIAPHRVLAFDGPKTVQVHRAAWKPSTSYGHLRGGAPPVLVGDEYYHWFHGAKDSPQGRLYTVGLYTFDAKPPFAPRRVARQPLFYPDMKDRPKDLGSHLAGVVFPCGALLRGDKWVVSYGYHDQWCRISEFDAPEVESCLSPV